jgi:hypothetical protein
MHWLSSSLDRLREGAREYAERGWRIAPAHYLSVPGRHRRYGRNQPTAECCSCRDQRCRRPGAHPLSVRWRTDATADLGTIGYWWYGPQPWNIALVTGELFDIWRAPADVSSRALEILSTVGARLPPVAHAPTGEWLLFTEARLGEPLIDIPPELPVTCHGEGDYVLAPPSQSGGGTVRWWRPPTAACARLPRWEPVAEALVQAARHRRSGRAVVPVPRAG